MANLNDIITSLWGLHQPGHRSPDIYNATLIPVHSLPPHLDLDDTAAMWWPFQWVVIYILGGLTFVPLVVVAIIGVLSLQRVRKRSYQVTP